MEKLPVALNNQSINSFLILQNITLLSRSMLQSSMKRRKTHYIHYIHRNENISSLWRHRGSIACLELSSHNGLHLGPGGDTVG